MLECVQGEGGVWPADLDYLRDVRALCQENGLVLIIDEVQTGFFRCGAPFSFQLAGIEPDVVSMAKGIADGFPTGAVAARAELPTSWFRATTARPSAATRWPRLPPARRWRRLSTSDMGEHVIAAGEHLAERLAALPHVTEVRGHGLMRGAQLDVPIATPLVERGPHAGLVLNHIGDSILRFLPPLVVTEEQIDEMCDRLGKLIEELA